MEALSERYGWTPQQIRDMDMQDVHQYLEIIKELRNQEYVRAMRQKGGMV